MAFPRLRRGFDSLHPLQIRVNWPFSAKKNRPRERFYLLPGQSGRAYRRKQKVFFKYSLIVGLVAAALVGGLMFLIAKITEVK